VYTLRRVLYLQAGVSFLAGVVMVAIPATLLRLFGESLPASGEQAWIRLGGVDAIIVAMCMVMVGHRVEDLWWWSWAFALGTLAAAAVALLNTAFGLGAGESAVAWWLFALGLLGLTCGLLYGLYVSSRERPLP
jgi:hypothetical protein